MRDFLLDYRKKQVEATLWSKLSESDQQDEITAAQEFSRTMVHKLVEMIAEQGLVCAHVEVSKFMCDVEKGEVTITSKGKASDEMLQDLANAKGRVAKLTIVDARPFNEVSTMQVPDPDQPDMLPPEDEKVEVSGAIADQLSDAGYTISENPDGSQEITPPEQRTSYAEGQAARFDGMSPDQNPYDGGTDCHIEWANGYQKANEDVASLEAEGAKAYQSGMDISDCPWKDNTPEQGMWRNGFNQAMQSLDQE